MSKRKTIVLADLAPTPKISRRRSVLEGATETTETTETPKATRKRRTTISNKVEEEEEEKEVAPKSTRKRTSKKLEEPIVSSPPAVKEEEKEEKEEKEPPKSTRKLRALPKTPVPNTRPKRSTKGGKEDDAEKSDQRMPQMVVAAKVVPVTKAFSLIPPKVSASVSNYTDSISIFNQCRSALYTAFITTGPSFLLFLLISYSMGFLNGAEAVNAVAMAYLAIYFIILGFFLVAVFPFVFISRFIANQFPSDVDMALVLIRCTILGVVTGALAYYLSIAV